MSLTPVRVRYTQRPTRSASEALVVALKARPATAFSSGWQKDVAKSIGLKPLNAFESFIDVDGEFLLERLQNLVKDALDRWLPILFQ